MRKLRSANLGPNQSSPFASPPNCRRGLFGILEGKDTAVCDYSYFTHKHNFAVWASARAAQRGFTSVAVLRDALEQSGVVEFLRDPNSLNVSQASFDALHAEWCRSVMRRLRRKQVRNVTFGRAAKLIAVYLKTMVVIGADPQSSLATVGHPPIDRILLRSLARAGEIKSPAKREWARINWTELDETGYRRLIKQLRACWADDEPMWHLEKHWSVTPD